VEGSGGIDEHENKIIEILGNIMIGTKQSMRKGREGRKE
jgi:hypothetical protein